MGPTATISIASDKIIVCEPQHVAPLWGRSISWDGFLMEARVLVFVHRLVSTRCDNSVVNITVNYIINTLKRQTG